MKKQTLFLLFMLLAMPGLLRAQSRMTFNNLPLTGTIEEMAGKLMAQGFTHLKTDKDMIYLKGRYLNRDCEVVLLATPITQTIWKVYVALPNEFTWSSLKNDFSLYQKQFENLYGFAESYQFFQLPCSDGDGNEIKSINGGKCTWLSIWKPSSGTIFMEIQRSARISISYEDGVNLALKHSEEKQLLQGYSTLKIDR